MNNILSYFVKKDANYVYEYILKNNMIKIYNNSFKLVFILQQPILNSIIINNFEYNIYKKIINNRQIEIITNKYKKDSYEQINIIYFNKDKLIDYSNFNIIEKNYRFINSIKYNIRILLDSSDHNLYFIYKNRINNKHIYKYKNRLNIFTRKYIKYHILIPNKYELYYYSNYFHIYFG
jgi:hypothetical protein